MPNYPTGREGQRVKIDPCFPVPVLAGREGIIVDDAGPGCTVIFEGPEGEFRFMDSDVEVLESEA